MRYDPVRRKYVVRWRENGRQPVKRFDDPDEAEAFERTLVERPSAAGEPHNPEVATLAARLAELEAKLAVASDETEAPGDGVFPRTSARQSVGVGAADAGFSLQTGRFRVQLERGRGPQDPANSAAFAERIRNG